MNPYIRLLSTGSFGRPCRNKLSPVQEAKAPTSGAVQQAAVVARALPRSHWYRTMRSKPGPPATLGSTANAHLELIVLCRDCRHKAEPDPAEMAAIRCRLAGPGVGQAARLQQVQKENTVMVNPMILRTAFVIALLMALGGVLSACGFSNTFNYGHGQGACENCGDEQ